MRCLVCPSECVLFPCALLFGPHVPPLEIYYLVEWLFVYALRASDFGCRLLNLMREPFALGSQAKPAI